jgi:RNA polymerase sigma-70 factor, ECF subfamily
VDNASIEDLYRTYGPSVLRRARALLGDDQAARDAMQEVFFRALRTKVKFYEGMSPMTWFYRVTTNYCLNSIRNQGRRTRALFALPKNEAVDGALEDRVAIRELLGIVPEELGQIAVYYYVDQMNQDEIAEIVGVSRRTIGNRLEEFRRLARVELDHPLEAM